MVSGIASSYILAQILAQFGCFIVTAQLRHKFTLIRRDAPVELIQ